MRTPDQWTLTRLVTGLTANVLVEPVRSGTFRLKGHSHAVAGIAVFVGLAFGALLAAIAAARPLRSASEFVADTSSGATSVVPAFLVPLMLFLLGLAFALVLAGSQRSHPLVRAVTLMAVVVIVGTVVLVVPNRDAAGAMWWVAVSGLVATVGYAVLIWWGRTAAGVDFLILFVLLEATIIASYRATVLGQASTDLRFDIVTASLLLTYLSVLASPVALAAGLSAVGVGVAAGAWSAEFLGRRARPTTLLILIIVIGAWQAWITIGNVRAGVEDDVGQLLRAWTSAIVVAALGWFVGRALVGRRSRAEDSDDSDVSANEVVRLVSDAGRFGLPVGYALQAIVILTALLGVVILGLAVLAPDTSTAGVRDLTDALSSERAVAVAGWAVVGGLLVAATALARKSARLPAAIAAVDAIVIGSLIATSGDAWLSGWAWQPSSFGDLGVVMAAILATSWAIRGRWSADRAAFLLVVLLMSGLIRQAAILEVPMGFLLSASTTGLLVFGLFWSFLTGGAATHEDGRHASRDRRLLLFLGESLYALALVAWAVIGKDIGASGTLSQVAAKAVLTVGTALVLMAVYQHATWVRPTDQAWSPADLPMHDRALVKGREEAKGTFPSNG